MIYYATRESESYLDRISKISSIFEPHCLVSVIGGMAFLHAIGPATTELILFDMDKDAIAYCKTIISLIKASNNIEDFISMIFGCTVNSNGEFEALIDRESFSSLLDSSTFESYKRIFGSFETDLEQRTSRLQITDTQESMIMHFSGNTHKYMHFNWLFGRFAFENNESFLALKNKLSNISISYKCCLAKNLNPKEVVLGHQQYYLLMSNCESFSQSIFNETIYEYVVDNNAVPFTYIGWGKCIHNNANKNHRDAVEKISRITTGRNVLESKTYLGYNFTKSEINPKLHEPIILEELQDKIKNFVGKDIFLYHISLDPKLPIEEKREQFTNMLKKIKDNFKTIIILEWQRSLSTDELMKLFVDCKMHYYYTAEIDWSGNNGYTRSTIMVWNKRGMF